MKKLYTLLFIIGLSFAFVNSCYSQAPVAAFSCSDSTICLYDCINFTNLSTNATSYKWIFQGGTPALSTHANPTVCYYDSIGSFTVTLIAINSGGSDTSRQINYINVNPIPPTPYIFQRYDTLFCSTDTSYVSYQWFYDASQIPNATDTFYVLTVSGNYGVMVTNRYGCNVAVSPNITEGIKNYSTAPAIAIYPNPASRELLVHVYNNAGNAVTVTITNALGEITGIYSLMTSENAGDETSVDVSAFSPGIYFADFRSGRGRWVKKFVKE